MYTIGIDSGSVATKGVLFNGNIVKKIIKPTGWNPKETSLDVLRDLKSEVKGPIETIIGTGYGRVSMDFTDKNLTEITCHAAGAFYLQSDIDTILDIGGQDSKVIAINHRGKVKKFLMNDKCAAGTGVFLQETLAKLGINIDTIDTFEKPDNIIKISNMCAVFATSEIVGLLAKGTEKNQIVHAIASSIAHRSHQLMTKLHRPRKVLFTGGLSQSTMIRKAIEEALGVPLISLEDSPFAGAIGAAKIAYDHVEK